MINPVLVEVLRGNVVESRHRGAVAVADADGRSVLALGEIARPVYPRSAIKALQALQLIESGAADRFGLAPEAFTITQLRGIYRAVLGHDVSATNLQRVLQRRGQLELTGESAPAGGSGRRPAALYRFTRRSLQITDPFAALRPSR